MRLSRAIGSQTWMANGSWIPGGNTHRVFGANAAKYDLLRPNYAPALWAHIAALLGSHAPSPARVHHAADLGCGTGRGTFELAQLPSMARVHAIDPDEGMLAQLDVARDRFNPAVADRVVARVGTIEQTGLEACSLMLAACFQAWHWADHSRALAEMHRVVQPGGFLCVVWNDRDLTSPWVSTLETMFERFNPKYNRHLRYEAIFAQTPARMFEARGEIAFAHTFVLPRPSSLVAFAETLSYVTNALSPKECDEFAAECLRFAEEEAPQQPDGSIHMPLVTRLFTLQRPPV